MTISTQGTVALQCNCMQSLGALLEDLVIRLLRAASTPLAEQLRLLPSTFHAAAVHAAFPAIDADRSICVDASDPKYAPVVEALWPALSRITSIRIAQKKICVIIRQN